MKRISHVPKECILVAWNEGSFWERLAAKILWAGNQLGAWKRLSTAVSTGYLRGLPCNSFPSVALWHPLLRVQVIDDKAIRIKTPPRPLFSIQLWASNEHMQLHCTKRSGYWSYFLISCVSLNLKIWTLLKVEHWNHYKCTPSIFLPYDHTGSFNPIKMTPW